MAGKTQSGRRFLTAVTMVSLAWLTISPATARKAAAAVFYTKDGQARSALAEAARAVLGPACRAATSATSAWEVVATCPLALDTLKQRLMSAEPQFGSFFEGDISVVDTEAGPLRDIYNVIQAILQHTDLPEAERPMMERRREVTVRLLHYDSSIKRNFAVNYRSQIEAGYSALQMPTPDFSQLSRKQALSAVSAFTKNLNAASPQASAQLGLLLTKGLRDLDQQYIPTTWI